ncbi:MAG: single-stranded DNA-binding protein [Proteobacteria bacterium]|jgi:single-strand DNA-binding protein|nr:single-stranded DNA-binding protein [Pseudomonadota bacterium]
MASVNKVILVGNLGRDPELRYTKNGQAVANFSLATTDNFTSKDGQKEERTEWHRVVAWAKTAELCAQYLAKGRSVYIEGQLRTREWEDKEGHKRQTTEVHAQTVQFLGPRSQGGQAGQSGAGGGGAATRASEPGASATSDAPPADDEIPF